MTAETGPEDDIGATRAARSLGFRNRAHNRYWWFNIPDNAYVPPVFAGLSEAEWEILDAWFADTERRFPSPGEISVPAISMLSALIGGNGLSRVVQAGHYAGYSTLLLGFLLRGMGKRQALFSIDIDAEVTDYARDWAARAGLADIARLVVSDSAAPAVVEEARAYLGGAPQLVLIDSSHNYDHTLKELDLWYEAIQPGGMIVLHDASVFAQSFDASGHGGVRRAVLEWSRNRRLPLWTLNGFVDGSQSVDELSYRDGCGLGFLQKPMAVAPRA